MGLNPLIGLVVFALDVWAIASIFNAKVETAQKVLWIVLVLALPVIGFIIWYFAGPKPTR
ncbi:PLD nuclease N-terminal domain-containing protein [Litoreibacter janthinus]|uniref:Phospholipase_D-nuclease N-terminal n=1 Tax=Litoreibacter janthinus TaxID=670154 RepID=A0A1I6G1P7_9RHOB|nr:PLD nuclease N-terminal domain-containing protein [Litoreibacter janthinus]SFR36106.1 Phospholipase_D-nuclease N-terminal [Litoreibacter janthinus]